MLAQFVVVVFAVSTLLVPTVASNVATSSTCQAGDELDDGPACLAPETVGGEYVEISGTIDRPEPQVLGEGHNPAHDIGYEAPIEAVDSVGESWCDLQRLPCVPWTPPADVVAAGPVSISDIATFRPQPPSAGMQPNQWMIVGLDTNFYANASAHIVDGTLFGGTAQVRFTPIAYSWEYGDNSTATLGTAGSTWAKQKISEFDPTPTSHIYEQSGTYTIQLAVTYAAEYRVAGSGWRTVIGTLSIASPPLTATAGHATTVLVDKDCNANPTGLGC